MEAAFGDAKATLCQSERWGSTRCWWIRCVTTCPRAMRWVVRQGQAEEARLLASLGVKGSEGA